MNTQQAYPLSWPAGWKRSPARLRSRFEQRSVAAAIEEVFNQLRGLGVGDYNVIISTNLVLRNDGLPRSDQRQPSDTGVAVYFQLNKKQQVLACDKWVKVEENLWAIAKHIEALRGQNRWGVGSIMQAFAGYTALPSTERKEWWEVLGVAHNATTDQIKEAFRERAKSAHPDNGGTHDQMAAINAAYKLAMGQ